MKPKKTKKSNAMMLSFVLQRIFILHIISGIIPSILFISSSQSDGGVTAINPLHRQSRIQHGICFQTIYKNVSSPLMKKKMMTSRSRPPVVNDRDGGSCIKGINSNNSNHQLASHFNEDFYSNRILFAPSLSRVSSITPTQKSPFQLFVHFKLHNSSKYTPSLLFNQMNGNDAVTGGNGNDDDDDDDDNGANKKKNSIARAGGRSKTDSAPTTPTTSSQIPLKALFATIKKVIPILISLSIIKGFLGFLFSGFGGRSNVIYYQSTVYESTTFDENGQMEQTRKESFKSNIPSLTNGDIGNRGLLDSARRNRDIEEEIEREIDAELQNVRRSTFMNNYDY